VERTGGTPPEKKEETGKGEDGKCKMAGGKEWKWGTILGKRSVPLWPAKGGKRSTKVGILSVSERGYFTRGLGKKNFGKKKMEGGRRRPVAIQRRFV